MKKLFAIVLALLMMVMLVACEFGSQEETDAGTQTTGQVETTEGTVPDEETTEPTEESSEATEEPTEESKETTEEASEATEGATVDPDDVDISNAVESTSAEEPAKLGQWIKSTRYSAASGEYETIYWRAIGTNFF